MKKLTLLCLSCILFYYAQGQNQPGIKQQADGTYRLTTPAASVVVESRDGARQWHNLKDATPVQQNEVKTLKNHFVVEFVDRPFFHEKKQRKGLRNARHLARFTELANDMRRSAQSRNEAVRMKRQFHKIFFGAEVEMSREVAGRISQLPYVKRVTEVQSVEAVLDQSVPVIKADAVWNQLGNRGEGITVGIVDTGIDYTHPALGNGFGQGYKVTGGYDFVNDDNDPMDDHGHGTHCAGIVAGDGGGILGVAPKAKLVALKVLSASGSGWNTDIIEAIEWAADPNGDGDDSDRLDVLSLSLGGNGDADDPLSAAVDHATTLGMVVCVAAGNSYYNFKISSPGTARKAITVGASDNVGNIAGFSSKGPNGKIFSIKPEVVAPGVNIESSIIGGQLGTKSGTSMATPHVAGIAALLRSLHPSWTPDQVKSALMVTAADLGKEVMSQGSGLVNALKAATVTTFAEPAHLSFGMFSGAGTEVKRDTIYFHNADTIAKSYATNITGTPGGLALLSTPAAFALQPGETRQVIFTATADHNTLPVSYAPSGTYAGKIVFTCSADTIAIPWAVVKTGILELTFDIPYPAITIGGRKANYSNIAIGNDGYSATVLAAPDTMDIVLYTHEAIMLRENLVFSGYDSIHVSESEAQHTVRLRAVDHNGDTLQSTQQSLQLNFPPESHISFMMAHPAFQQFRISSFSPRFEMILSQLKEDVAGSGTIHNVQHPPVSGLQQNVTCVNDPSSYLTQDVVLHAPVSPFKLNVASHFMRENSYSYYGTVSYKGDFTDLWRGKIYLGQSGAQPDQTNLSLDIVSASQPDVTNPYVAVHPFAVMGGAMGVTQNIPPTAETYLSPSGGTMSFGNTGTFYPRSITGYLWDMEFHGRLDERLAYESNLATYRIFNEAGQRLDSGRMTTLSESKLLPGKNRLEIRLQRGNVLKGRYTATFDRSKPDFMPPQMTSLQFRNSDGILAGGAVPGNPAVCRFSIDYSTTEKHFFVRPHNTTSWQEISVVTIAERVSGPWAFGYLYEASLASPDTTGAFDIRITAADASQNTMEWILESAFVIDGEPEPEIEVKAGGAVVVSGAQVDYGTLLTYSAYYRTVSITNTGNDTLNFSGVPQVIVTGPDSTSFRITKLHLPSQLMPGEAGTFMIEFLPVRSGNHTATLTVANDDADEDPFILALAGNGSGADINVQYAGSDLLNNQSAIDLGSLSLGVTGPAHTFRIENKGNVQLNLTGALKVWKAAPNSDSFSSFIVDQATLPASLAPGSSATFTVKFKPTTLGDKVATLTIVNNDPNENPFVFVLNGKGVAADVNVQYAGLDLVNNTSVVRFDTVAVGQSAPVKTFTLENKGNINLDFIGTPVIAVSGNCPQCFKVTQTGVPAQLAPGAAATFTVEFKPTSAGDKSAFIYMRSNDPDEDIYAFIVRGRATAADINVKYAGGDIISYYTILTLDTVPVWQTGPAHTFTIENKGDMLLNFSGSPKVAVTGVNPDCFIVTQNLPGQLAPGATATFTVAFRPTSTGNKSGFITIGTNDPDENPHGFGVKGTGTAAALNTNGARLATSSADARGGQAMDGSGEEVKPVMAFPNPSRQGFTVWTGGTENEKLEVRVYNSLGHSLSYHIWPGGSHESIGDTWMPGLYILELRNSSRRNVIKLIKE